jgi:hypothetical protein
MNLSSAARRKILAAPTRIFWRASEGNEGPAAHAYLSTESGSPVLLHLVHHADTTPGMQEILKEWQAIHPDASETARLRAITTWRPPASAWSFSMDAGAVEKELTRGELRHEHVLGPDASSALSQLPEAFLRAPVSTIIRSLLGDVAWPPDLDASVLRPDFRHARHESDVVVTGCRYGSKHASAGQDRTAAVFWSKNGGRAWQELEWKLPLSQRLTPSGQSCFPPEQIDRVRFERLHGELVPVVEWEDPWIAFEPGSEWQAHYEPRSADWIMSER